MVARLTKCWVVLGTVTVVGATTSGLLALLCLLLGASTLVMLERRAPASG